MRLTNEELKNIYFGAYSYEDTKDGYLQAFQYTKAQMDYFKKTSEFWYDRCMASTAKTLEFVTEAERIFFTAYWIIPAGTTNASGPSVNGRSSPGRSRPSLKGRPGRPWKRSLRSTRDWRKST